MSKIPVSLVLDTNAVVSCFKEAVKTININPIDLEEIIRQIFSSLLVDKAGFISRLDAIPDASRLVGNYTFSDFNILRNSVRILGYTLFHDLDQLSAFLPDEDGITSLPFYFDRMLGNDVILKGFQDQDEDQQTSLSEFKK